MNTITLPFATVTKVPNEKLGGVMAKIFPKDFLAIEFGHYQTLEGMTDQYQGGLWSAYTNPEHTVFFMVPPGDKYTLSVEGNYYHGTLSAEATGIVTSLVAINGLLWQTRNPAYNELFYNLRSFALDHPEQEAIFGAID